MDKNKANQKNFVEWLQLKSKLHQRHRHRSFNEGEIWWCAVGENIGVEINGKGQNFCRPILILRKLGRYSFMAIPLTSKVHTGNWYTNFIFQNQLEIAVLAQARVLSVRRLYQYIGTVSNDDFNQIIIAFHQLYFHLKK